MNVVNLVKNSFPQGFKGKISDGISYLVNNTNLSASLKAVNTYVSDARARLFHQDSFNCGFVNVSEIYNDYALTLLEQQPFTDAIEKSIEISSESGQQMLSGLANSVDEAGEILVTSSSGLAYSISVDTEKIKQDVNGQLAYYNTDDGIKPLIERIGGKFKLHLKAFPMNYVHDIEHPTINQHILGLLHDVCALLNLPAQFTTYEQFISICNDKKGDNSIGTLEDAVEYLGSLRSVSFTTVCDTLINTINKISRISHTNLIEHFYTILLSQIVSAEINECLIGLGSAICCNQASAFLSSVSKYFTSKYQAVKDVFNHMYNAFSTGGFKGLIMYFISFLDKGSKLSDAEGRLVFTDNSVYLPTDYIAGLVTTTIGFIISAIALIASIFIPALGMALSTLVATGIGVFNSFAYDYNSTRASLDTFSGGDSGNDSVTYADYCQLGTFRGEITAPEWYQQFAASGDEFLSIDVPGGVLIIGPGRRNTDNQVVLLRYEFHPAHIFYDHDYLRTALDGTILINYTANQVDIKPYSIAHGGGTALIERVWKSLATPGPDNRAVIQLINQNNGFLNEVDDATARGSLSVNYLIFWLYLLFIGKTEEDFDQNWCLWTDMSDDPATPPDYSASDVFINSTVRWIVKGGTTVHTWSGLINSFETNEDGLLDSSILCHFYNSTWTTLGGVSYFPSVSLVGSYVISDQHYYGTPVPINSTIKWPIKLPQYSATSFWFCVGLAAAAAVAIIATAIGVSVRWSKFRKEVRAKNVVKAADAQSTYQAAVRGEKLVYNEQTHQYDTIKFDVKSPEGEAYLKQCWKDYKLTVLSNNIWAHFIGGTRYDATSMFGDAAEAESDSAFTSPSTLFHDYVADVPMMFSPAPEVELTTGQNVLYKAITGSDWPHIVE